ncbi:MAG: metal ABC transporter substrate-binding protein [Solirubrobacterales bacterium]
MKVRAKPIASFALALAVAAALAACGDDGRSGSGRPTVTATTGILTDITRNVAGTDAEVDQIIPDSTSPHEFQLSAKQRAEIEDSALFVHNGAGLEQGIPFDDIDAPDFALADHVGALRPLKAVEPGEASGDDDPHIWMDPTRVELALPALAEALAGADPAHAAGYRERARRYARRIALVDREVRTTLASIPAGDRQLVTSHDALGYFADRYGLEVIATPFPASGPEAEASAATVRDVEAAIRSSGVPAVFAQETDDPKVLRNIASATGVEIVEDLQVEAPGESGSYAAMLSHDAQLIRDGLVP